MRYEILHRRPGKISRESELRKQTKIDLFSAARVRIRSAFLQMFRHHFG
jgi:hypothetical protein